MMAGNTCMRAGLAANLCALLLCNRIPLRRSLTQVYSERPRCVIFRASNFTRVTELQKMMTCFGAQFHLKRSLPYAPCMEYLAIFTPLISINGVKCKCSIHGAYGDGCMARSIWEGYDVVPQTSGVLSLCIYLPAIPVASSGIPSRIWARPI